MLFRICHCIYTRTYNRARADYMCICPWLLNYSICQTQLYIGLLLNIYYKLLYIFHQKCFLFFFLRQYNTRHSLIFLSMEMFSTFG
jgi:hypothetical protein